MPAVHAGHVVSISGAHSLTREMSASLRDAEEQAEMSKGSESWKNVPERNLTAWRGLGGFPQEVTLSLRAEV